MRSRVVICIALLLAALLATPVFAQELLPPQTEELASEVEQLQDQVQREVQRKIEEQTESVEDITREVYSEVERDPPTTPPESELPAPPAPEPPPSPTPESAPQQPEEAPQEPARQQGARLPASSVPPAQLNLVRPEPNMQVETVPEDPILKSPPPQEFQDLYPSPRFTIRVFDRIPTWVYFIIFVLAGIGAYTTVKWLYARRQWYAWKNRSDNLKQSQQERVDTLFEYAAKKKMEKKDLPKE